MVVQLAGEVDEAARVVVGTVVVDCGRALCEDHAISNSFPMISRNGWKKVGPYLVVSAKSAVMEMIVVFMILVIFLILLR